MKITDEEIIQALKDGKHISKPGDKYIYAARCMNCVFSEYGLRADYYKDGRIMHAEYINLGRGREMQRHLDISLGDLMRDDWFVVNDG